MHMNVYDLKITVLYSHDLGETGIEDFSLKSDLKIMVSLKVC